MAADLALRSSTWWSQPATTRVKKAQCRGEWDSAEIHAPELRWIEPWPGWHREELHHRSRANPSVHEPVLAQGCWGQWGAGKRQVFERDGAGEACWALQGEGVPTVFLSPPIPHRRGVTSLLSTLLPLPGSKSPGLRPYGECPPPLLGPSRPPSPCGADILLFWRALLSAVRRNSYEGWRKQPRALNHSRLD